MKQTRFERAWPVCVCVCANGETSLGEGVVKPDEIVFTELMRGHLKGDPPAWRGRPLVHVSLTHSLTHSSFTREFLVIEYPVHD